MKIYHPAKPKSNSRQFPCIAYKKLSASFYYTFFKGAHRSLVFYLPGIDFVFTFHRIFIWRHLPFIRTITGAKEGQNQKRAEE
jgi:hypothetical protein